MREEWFSSPTPFDPSSQGKRTAGTPWPTACVDLLGAYHDDAFFLGDCNIAMPLLLNSCRCYTRGSRSER